MSTSNGSSSSGISISGVVAIVFIVLKLTGLIDWSWWWVLSPLWIAFLAGFLLVLGTVAFYFALNKDWR